MRQNEPMTTSTRDDYWRRTRRLTAWLLLAWAVVAFVPVFFARELSVEVFGWPLGFWLASQGALLGFCAIVVVYARAMAKLEREVSAPRS
jgi:putative solute:sodium symporter small subunit